MNKIQGLYEINGHIVDDDYYLAVMSFAKLLYRLRVIDQEQALELAMEFHPVYV